MQLYVISYLAYDYREVVVRGFKLPQGTKKKKK